jgi:crotonobetainyl-CoA:carnitine CoA-transferase CaiB-like acyl-CoA transferase
MSGFAHITGEAEGPPTLPPFGLADSIAGISAACAAMMALYHRDARSGGGQSVDLAILEPIVTALGPQPTIYDQLGMLQQRTGNRSDNNAPRNTYKTKDGRWVAISTSATSIAERVMRLVGRPEFIEEPWFHTAHGRVMHVEELDGAVADWIARRTRDEVIEAFEAAEAAIAPIYDVAELMDDPHAQAREMFVTVEDSELGPVRMQNVLYRMEETPGEIRFPGRRLGADTDEILSSLGLEASRIAELRERGIVA